MPGDTSIYGYRILAVDDHFIGRAAVALAFENAGVLKAEMARNGADAIKKIEAVQGTPEAFDVVFLDYNMPDMTGGEVLKYFKDKQDLQNPLFVMVSAESDPKIVKQAIADGVTKWLIKPVTQEKIVKALQDIASQTASDKRQKP